MGGLRVSIPKGTGRGRGTGNTPNPGGDKTAAARNNLISFRANSLSATVEPSVVLTWRVDKRRRQMMMQRDRDWNILFLGFILEVIVVCCNLGVKVDQIWWRWTVINDENDDQEKNSLQGIIRTPWRCLVLDDKDTKDETLFGCDRNGCIKI